MPDDDNSPDWKGYGVDQAVTEQWVRTRFGDKVFESIEERTARICEEANELHQAEARDKVKARAVAHAIVDRVFDKASGVVEQEVGGVIVTTLAYCAAKGMRLDVLAGKEIARVMQDDPKKFKDKQAAKADLGIAMRPE